MNSFYESEKRNSAEIHGNICNPEKDINMIYYQYVDSPVGKILVAGDGERLRLIRFTTGQHRYFPESDWVEDRAPLKEILRWIEAYFSGKRNAFSLNLYLDVTPFQKKVLTAVQQIPYGGTASYGEIARKIGSPRASRAVGQANARNPIPIVIPCHRVVGSNGKLTGFGGGLSVKQSLLDMERRYRYGEHAVVSL